MSAGEGTVDGRSIPGTSTTIEAWRRMQNASDDLEHRFTHHPPDEAKAKRHEELRAAFKQMAYEVVCQCGQNREASLALTKLEEAMFWANASLARNDV